MPFHRSTVRTIAIAALLAAPPTLLAQPIPEKIPHGPVQVRLAPVVSGLTAPVDMAFVPGDPNSFFVLEQPGQIKRVTGGVVQPPLVLDATGTTVPMRPGYDERGLLGIAFDPGFNDPSSPGHRRFFTWASEPTFTAPTYPLTTSGTIDHTNVLASYRVSPTDPNVVEPGSRTVLLSIQHPAFNHNGGDIAFGPDGHLYLGTGDGGGANDVGNGHNPTIGNARDLNSPLGKMLRIDVNGTDRGNYGIPADNPFVGGAVPEVWAYGFRNPYRFSFHGSRLLVADVGQNNLEEVNDVVKGGHYGWNAKEGTFRFNPADGTVSSDLTGVPAGLIDPIVQYDHDEGIAIVGGFVYTGSKFPELAGKYVFGDFSLGFGSPNGRLFYADLDTGAINEFILAPGDQPLGLFVKGIGQGPDGEIYLMASTALAPTGTTGVIYQLVPEPASALLLTGLIAIGRRQR